MSAPYRKRNVQMIVRVTQEERDYIMEKMKQSGISSFNAFAWMMLMGGKVNNVDLTHYHELAKEVRSIGTNINQIAKFTNSNGRIYPQEIMELQERMNEIWRLLKSNLSAALSKSP